MVRIVYSRRYNLRCFGLGRLHAFDTGKYGRAWRVIRRSLGAIALRQRISPPAMASRADLLEVHSAAYLQRLRSSAYLAQILEVPVVARVPPGMLDWGVLAPMRWATAGSVSAMRAAMQLGLAVNLGGGFHHAKPEGGEGFCVYSDIALAMHVARQSLADDARIVYIDLDAHQGNGVAHFVRDDSRVFLFDMYNREIYPAYDHIARQRVDCPIPLTASTTERDYMALLGRQLPAFLDSVGKQRPIALAIYNAGTDVVAGDPLGQMNLSSNGVLQRDLFVVDQLRSRNLPTMMLLSGGYTPHSYQLVAHSVSALVRRAMMIDPSDD